MSESELVSRLDTSHARLQDLHGEQIAVIAELESRGVEISRGAQSHVDWLRRHLTVSAEAVRQWRRAVESDRGRMDAQLLSQLAAGVLSR